MGSKIVNVNKKLYIFYETVVFDTVIFVWYTRQKAMVDSNILCILLIIELYKLSTGLEGGQRKSLQNEW